MRFFDNVNDCWEFIYGVLNGFLDAHAPFIDKRVRGNNLTPWVNEEIKELMYKRDHYRKKLADAKKRNLDYETTNVYSEKYKAARNLLNITMREAKKQYYNDLIQENLGKPDKLWASLKKILPSSTNVSPHELEIDGKQISDSHHIANHFNTFFSTIGANLASKIPFVPETFPNNTRCKTKFKFSKIEPDEVNKLLQSLSNNKATGTDGIPARIVKHLAPALTLPLHYLFNLSLNTGEIPTMWKKGKVSPIYKEGPSNNPSNYRPICVLPIIMKTFEKLVHTRLYQHVVANNILNIYQSGFRPKHSTVTTLLDVQEYILNNTEKGLLTGVVFLDLKKAFDTVNANLLLEKLQHVGIEDLELAWFRDYLTSRTQVVNFNGHTSDACSMSYGVPQGSILGPLLFIIYINDLPSHLTNAKVTLYADDTALLFPQKSIKDIERVLSDELAIAQAWLAQNKLTLNLQKTKCMILSSKQRTPKTPLNIITNDMYGNPTRVEEVDSFKYLGVWIDKNLSWSSHIDHISKKISQRLGVLSRCRKVITQDTALLLYNALVLPLFDYADVVWKTCNKTDLVRLERLQKRGARIILQSGIRERSTVDLFKELNWLPLSVRLDLHTCILMYKCTHGLTPQYLTDFFTYTSKIHNYNTRQANNLQQNSCKGVQRSKSFFSSGPLLWNKLPNCIRESPSLNTFKKKCITHLKYNAL